MLERILHIEENEDIRFVVYIALSHLGGLDLLQCKTARDALTAAPGFRPQLLLLDVMNTGVRGESIWRDLRDIAGFEDVPVIFLTACVERDMLDELATLGALAVIAKPFDPMTLPDDLRQHWRRHRVSGPDSGTPLER